MISITTYILGGLASVPVLYFLWNRIQKLHKEIQMQLAWQTSTKIAIYPAIKNRITNTIFLSFVSFLKKYASFNFDIIETNDSEMRSIDEQIASLLQRDTSLIVTLGRNATDQMMNFLWSRRIRIPIIAAGIIQEAMPVGYVNWLREHADAAIIATPYNWHVYTDALASVFPIRRVALICNNLLGLTTFQMVQERNDIFNNFRRNKVEVSVIPLDTSNLEQSLKEHSWKNFDAVMFSRTDEISWQVGIIASFFSSLKIPLIAPGVFFLEDNVFLSIGSNSEEKIGKAAGALTLQILDEKKSPLTIEPVVIDDEETIGINLDTSLYKEEDIVTVLRNAQAKNPLYRVLIKENHKIKSGY